MSGRGGSKRGAPGGPNSFNLMQFLGNFGQNRMLAPPGGLAPPPRENPGSVNVYPPRYDVRIADGVMTSK